MKKLLLVVVSICLILGLAGCGKSNSPTDATKEFLKALKGNDAKAMEDVYAGNSKTFLKGLVESDGGVDAGISEDVGKELEDKVFGFEYTVSKEKIDGDKATVDVKIKTYNLGKVFTSFMEEYFEKVLPLAMSGASEADIEKAGAEILSSKLKDAKFDYEKTVSLSLSQKDDKWIVDEIDKDSDFYNALFGGMIEMVKELGDAFNQ